MNCVDCNKEIKQKFNFAWRCRLCGYQRIAEKEFEIKEKLRKQND